jgi:hypothetical protein
LQRDELHELHFITPIANLPSIAQHGIVCHRRAKSLGAVSIALEGVQERRSVKRVPEGLMLHDYACLYFNARNPMLYLRRFEHANLCVLRVRPTIIDRAGVVVTDQNAATKWARFAAAPDGISIVRRDRTFAEWWTHPENQIDEWRHKAEMCAEVLVPDCVPRSYLAGAYISGQVAEERFAELGELSIITTIDARLFFR